MKEAYLQKRFKDGTVQCQNCAHYCRIEKGKRGICAVRENREGKLYALNYGKAVACHVDPIEKKPFYHFLPNTYSLSIATVGCNFRCANCQNWEISQLPQMTQRIEGKDLPPEEIVKLALKEKTPSISYTYTEPAIFSEYALDTMKLARKEGLKNAWVSNGFWSKELFEMIAPYLDAANVDLKAFNDKFYQTYCKARLEPVKNTIKKMKNLGILVEITTLLIPGLNDAEDDIQAMADYIANDLGCETPWHISRFHPCYNMMDRPATPVLTLEKAYKAGKAAGLRYVYIGNVAGQSSENTYCHSCNALLVRRAGYQIKNFLLKQGKCPECNTIAYGIY